MESEGYRLPGRRRGRNKENVVSGVQPAREQQEVIYQVLGPKEGLKHINTVAINVSPIRTVLGLGFPNDRSIVDFLMSDQVGCTVKDIAQLTSRRSRGEVRVAFRSDMKCMEVEEKLLKGVKWHGNKEVVLYGYRLDKPTLHVRVLGVPPDIPACEMERIFSQYGQVTSLHRGSHPLISKGEEGGEDWVWDGLWNIYIKVAEEKTLPSNIIANDEHWEVQFRGSVQACFKCLATDHLSWR